jgi:tripartite-type tricarboxylate transporter receptor subunit TctC
LSRRESLLRAVLFLAFTGAPAAASAQHGSYPAKPVKLVIPYPPGVPAGTTAKQFRQFVHDEVAKSDRIVSQAGIQPE